MDDIFSWNFRSYVVGVDMKIPLNKGEQITPINFDNAATTPPLRAVLSDIINFAPWYSSIHRGSGYKSIFSSNVYDSSRKEILKFVGANSNKDMVIYVKNTTEAINKLSYRLCRGEKKCVILSTDMEHHSNDLPWRKFFCVDYINIDKYGCLDISSLKDKLEKYQGKVRLVTITGASNVTGIINPIHKVADLVHKYNCELLVDGAQLVPHHSVSMTSESVSVIDYLVFSAHKLYAPFGIGVLIGPRKTFEKGAPDLVGGGTVDVVTHEYVFWNDPPDKEEAGSPNIMGVVALLASIRTLNHIGMDKITLYESALTRYALNSLKNMEGIILYGDTSKSRVGIISFNINGLHHSIVSKILSNEGGISVRNGCFCAQPYIQKLLNINKATIKKFVKNTTPRPGMVRISFGLYNNIDEINIFLKLLKKIIENKNYYKSLHA
jgi:selenocysteine lyase/cysteine desulfurase